MPLVLVGRVGGKDLRFPLTPGEHFLGRGADCACRLADPSVSRRHACIAIDAGPGAAPRLRDLGSRNGTKVNDEPVDGEAVLARGDVVRVADIVLRIVEDAQPTPTVFAEGVMPQRTTVASWQELAGTSGGAAPNRLMQVVISAGDLLAAPRPLADLFEAILDQVQAAFAPQRCLLLLRDEESGELTVKASRPRDQDAGRLIFSRTLVNQVLSERSSLLTADAQSDPRFAGQESVIMQGLRSAMAAPLFDSEKVIGLLYADIADLGRFYTRDELQAFMLLANLVAVKITQARLEIAEREHSRMAHEIEAARDIMRRLLPDSPPAVAGYDVCAWLQPCLGVGGDLYDVREAANGRVLLMLGDVSGKGLAAALLVANLAPAVQLLTEESSDPLVIVRRLNRRLFACTDTVRFATLFLGLLEPATGELVYVNAAHVPPLLVSADGSIRELPPAGLPVGAFEEGLHQAGSVTLAHGDTLVVFSDGIPEALDSEEEFYGTTRLHELLVRGCRGSAGEIIEAVRDDLTSFLAGQPLSDDVTLLVVRHEDAISRETGIG